MSAGYGRGYYGDAQLRPRSSGGWVKPLAIGAGLGVLVWLMWPTKPRPPGQVAAGVSPPSPSDEALAQATRDSSVLASARQLRSVGAAVALPPHLRHLEPLL